MCGIVGFFDKKKRLDESEKHLLLLAMLEKIAHRGNDAQGTFIEGDVAFAHARLSIIDLSSLGNQPMKSDKSRLHLSYNGEIYNHRDIRKELEGKYPFRSQSDTETLLYGYEEWGAQILSKIKGMFAFSFYNATTEEIFLAIDRFGIKPLYYIDSPDWFAWSSEIKALQALPGVSLSLDKSQLPEYLLFRSLAGQQTLFLGVKKLLPSEFISFQLKTKEPVIKRYWELTAHQTSIEGSHEAAILGALEKSVSEHMLADVPVGIQLSGGVDSSLIGSLVRKNISPNEELHSFSIGLAEPEWNEFPYSRLMAERLNTTHHELVFTEEDFCKALPTATYYYDEPINHSHSVPMMLLAEEANKYVKVLMSGEGSDEIFGGYRRYLSLVDNKTLNNKELILSNAFSSPQEVIALTKCASLNFPYREKLMEISRAEDPLFQLGYYDIHTYLTPLLLRQDKMGMRSTLENRVPFLDHELVQLAFALPLEEKIKEGESKFLLKKVALTYLPQEISHRKKVGFSQPISVWLRNEKLFGKYLSMVIDANKRRGLFDHATLISLRDEHLSGNVDRSGILWTLITLELWTQIFIDGKEPSTLWQTLS